MNDRESFAFVCGAIISVDYGWVSSATKEYEGRKSICGTIKRFGIDEFYIWNMNIEQNAIQITNEAEHEFLFLFILSKKKKHKICPNS